MKKYAYFTAALVLAAALASPLAAGRLSDNRWEVLAVAYPPDREVSVAMGGAERSLTARGRTKVKWRDGAADLELEIDYLPAPAEVGRTGQQYVLWAIDSERRVLNLGAIPWHDRRAKLRVQVPFRVFGLLVTAEEHPQADVPSDAVALESLLPSDPFLVVPVFRVPVDLNPAAPG